MQNTLKKLLFNNYTFMFAAAALPGVIICGTLTAGALQHRAAAAAVHRCVATHTAAGHTDPVAVCTPHRLQR